MVSQAGDGPFRIAKANWRAVDGDRRATACVTRSMRLLRSGEAVVNEAPANVGLVWAAAVRGITSAAIPAPSKQVVAISSIRFARPGS